MGHRVERLNRAVGCGSSLAPLHVIGLLLLAVGGLGAARQARAQVPDAAAGLTADQRARLDRCEVLVSSPATEGAAPPKFLMLAVIDVPPAKLWPIVERCGGYKGMFPRVSKSEERERKAGRVVCHVEIDMPFPLRDLWHTTECLHASGPGPRYRRAWKLLEGTFEHNTGTWIIGPWGPDQRRSLLRYTASVKPHMSVPGPIRRHFQRRSLPSIVHALRTKLGVSECAPPAAAAEGTP